MIDIGSSSCWLRASSLRSCLFLLLLLLLVLNYSSIFALFRHALPYFVILLLFPINVPFSSLNPSPFGPCPFGPWPVQPLARLAFHSSKCFILPLIRQSTKYFILPLIFQYPQHFTIMNSFVPSLTLNIINLSIPFNILLKKFLRINPFTARSQVMSFRR